MMHKKKMGQIMSVREAWSPWEAEFELVPDPGLFDEYLEMSEYQTSAYKENF